VRKFASDSSSDSDEEAGEVAFLGQGTPRLFPTSRAAIQHLILRDAQPETQSAPRKSRDLAQSGSAGGEHAHSFYLQRALEQVARLYRLRQELLAQVQQQNRLAENRVSMGLKRGQIQQELARLDRGFSSSPEGEDAMALEEEEDVGMRQHELMEEDARLEEDIRRSLSSEQASKAVMHATFERFDADFLRFQNDLVGAGLLAEATPDTTAQAMDLLVSFVTLPQQEPKLEGFEFQERRAEPMTGAPIDDAPDQAALKLQAGRDGFVCPVCLQYKGKKFGLLKKCNHVICETCFKWLKYQVAATKSKACCPLCKVSFGKSGFDYIYI
jgi:hypothetical protein